MADRRSFQIGRYRLDDSIDTLTGLIEFSPVEYSMTGRSFEGETIYNALPVTFLGRPWKLMIGAVEGRIYKVAPYLELQQKTDANLIAMDALNYCTEKLGKPDTEETGLFVWDTVDGNVILRTGETAGGFEINLFLTSNAVRRFRPGFRDEASAVKTFVERYLLGTKCEGLHDAIRRVLLVKFSNDLNDPDLGAAFMGYVFSESPASERAKKLLAEHRTQIEKRVEEMLTADGDLRDLAGFGLLLAMAYCCAYDRRDQYDALARSRIFSQFRPSILDLQNTQKWPTLQKYEGLVHKLQKQYGIIE